MGFNLIVAFAVLCAVGVAAVDKVDCIHQKFVDCLGESYRKCHDKSGSTRITRIKQCYQEVMKAEGVVKTASNGQMTVDRKEFEQYGRNHNNHLMRQATTECIRKANNDGKMYEEAARVSQCMFEELTKGC